MNNDYYAVLGISRKASQKEISQAYRRLARKYHPDLNKGNKEAESIFKQINEANEVLSDTENRNNYDTFGENWKNADELHRRERPFQGNNFTWGFSNVGGNRNSIQDIINRFNKTKANNAKPRKIEKTINITLLEAFTGTSRVINIGDAESSNERKIEVKIPPGVDNGSKIHVQDKHTTNFYLVTKISKMEDYKRIGNDLHTKIDLDLLDAIFGIEIELNIIGERILFTVPPETQNGTSFRLSGKGMPLLKSPDKRGNMYLSAHIRIPTALSKEEKELFLKLKSLRESKE
ncbi:MAG: J domain-containing protein [SAR202 cluster bacterium]|nr:J domain-containing protein [SAR202 cluster bacterium]|tara:strand:- start:32657 stop:33526 length:870 start_codon:yes stop_codon:yes gene_type:complete